jgi:hypothetical protein
MGSEQPQDIREHTRRYDCVKRTLNQEHLTTRRVHEVLTIEVATLLEPSREYVILRVSWIHGQDCAAITPNEHMVLIPTREHTSNRLVIEPQPPLLNVGPDNPSLHQVAWNLP